MNFCKRAVTQDEVPGSLPLLVIATQKTKPGGNSSRVAEQPPRDRFTDEVTPLLTIPASLVAQALLPVHGSRPRTRRPALQGHGIACLPQAGGAPNAQSKKQSATPFANFSGRNHRSQCYGIRTRDLSAFTRSNCELRHPGKTKHAFPQRICLNRKRLDRNDLG
jgi:hypothetical protein